MSNNNAHSSSLYHNCDSTTLRLRYDYDEKLLTRSFFACVNWKQARAIRRCHNHGIIRTIYSSGLLFLWEFESRPSVYRPVFLDHALPWYRVQSTLMMLKKNREIWRNRMFLFRSRGKYAAAVTSLANVFQHHAVATEKTWSQSVECSVIETIKAAVDARHIVFVMDGCCTHK